MTKIAFIFAGQGSQYVGMGQDIAKTFPQAQAIFNQASTQLGYDVLDLCSNGPEDKLMQTQYTQPAIVTVSSAIAAVLKDKGISPVMVAGLSLGEYTALVEAKAITIEQAVKLVAIRGRLMQEAVAPGQGKMVAVLGMDRQKVSEVLKQVDGVVEMANLNCQGQIVIGGESEAVDAAVVLLKENGCRRALPLKVSVPSHTSLMTPMSKQLKEVLDEIDFSPLQLPLITNVTGNFVDDQNVKAMLEKQVCQTTYWQDTIELMLNNDVDTFIEVGPGKVLSGFVKTTAKELQKEVTILNVQDLASLESTLQSLGEK